MRKEINSEILKIIVNEWIIKVISYEGQESP